MGKPTEAGEPLVLGESVQSNDSVSTQSNIDMNVIKPGSEDTVVTVGHMWQLRAEGDKGY